MQVELAGTWCESRGWHTRPTWVDLAAGCRPPEPTQSDEALGEWRHGWQYHSSWHIEDTAFRQLLADFALPSTRSNAAAAGKARLFSCGGRFASVWLTVCPTTELLTLDNEEMQVAMRRRLGIAIGYDGPDPHGHSSLTSNVGARLNAKHTALLVSWRQVFVEAGSPMPDRNVERLLRDTHIPVHPHDLRRIDLVVPGLNVARGVPRRFSVTLPCSLRSPRLGSPGLAPATEEDRRYNTRVLRTIGFTMRLMHRDLAGCIV